MCLISEVRIHGSPQSTLLTPLSQSLSHSVISAREPGKPAVHIPVRAWLGIRSCRKVTAWCDTDGEGDTTLLKRLEQLERYTTAFRDEAAPAAPSVWAGTSHGAANAPPQWIHQFVLTNPLLFALQPPQGLFPSPGAVGSSGLGASAAAAAAQTARVCQAAHSDTAQACRDSGLHGQGWIWLLAQAQGAVGAQHPLRSRRHRPVAPDVASRVGPCRPSLVSGTPQRRFWPHSSVLLWSPGQAELPRGEADFPTTVWGFGGSMCQLSSC